MYKQPSRNGSSEQIINKMKDLSNASTVAVDSASEGQRVDNFLLRLCKGVPRSHVYRILRSGEQHVSLPLKKFLTRSGERRVSVHLEGRESQTVFRKKKEIRGYTLLSAELLTGRTHQIRVHLTYLGFPIAGDDKYGDFKLNRELAKQGLKRMFLHAGELEFEHPLSGKALKLHAPLPEDLSRFLDFLGS